MRAYERLLNYVKVYTTSEDEQEYVPSTSRQFDLGNQLAEELKKIGVQDVRIDDKCYVYGVIPATEGLEEKPAIGFIAHMDTAPDFSGENVNPQIIPEYGGGDVKLGDSEYALTLKDFPHLASLKGRTLVTTDGSTLLGADDKAGVAEIMTMAEQVITENIPHGKICIGFTPDEEVGRGADFFDVEGFGADFAYTVDGGAENEIEYENFNAAGAKVKIKGFSVHPGSSKNTMINAALVAMEFNNMLPAGDTPANTEEYEGFFHLCEMSGDVSSASLDYIIRDHDSAMFACRQELMRHIVKLLNEKYDITESDFLSAELELVPAARVSDIGFDRSLIGGYGHDDRVCAYPALMAALDCLNPSYTTVTVLTDKEEIGSVGNTGLSSAYLQFFIEDLAKTQGLEGRDVLRASECLSADVNAGVDPTFQSVHDKLNASFINRGIVVTKYTGARGKSDTSDANAEFVGKLRKLFDENNIVWQIGELGKVDEGGGGTVAKYVAHLGVDVVDVGVPVLSMHAPFEQIAKLDIYMAYKAFCTFYNQK